MDAGLDTGAMLLKHSLIIAQEDTTQSLHDKLSVLGAQSIVEALVLLQQGKLVPMVQDEMLGLLCSQNKKTEAEIDWQQTAGQIDRVVRAFNPNPGAYTYFQNAVLKIWQARAVAGRFR